MPTEWWLRPVRSAWRVGEQSAVVWKRLYLSPFAARRSAVGRRTGAAEGARGAEAAVVDQDDEHVRRAVGRTQRLDRRERCRRILRVVRRQARVGAVRDRQNLALHRLGSVSHGGRSSQERCARRSTARDTPMLERRGRRIHPRAGPLTRVKAATRRPMPWRASSRPCAPAALPSARPPCPSPACTTRARAACRRSSRTPTRAARSRTPGSRP